MRGDIDILITDDDLTLDGVREPRLVDGRRSIAQDIKHMIRERGYVVQMIGERSRDRRRHFMKQMEIAVEEDQRIVPGTARVTETRIGQLFVTAHTNDYGRTGLQVIYA